VLVDANQVGEVAGRQPAPLPGVQQQQSLLRRDRRRPLRRQGQPRTATAIPTAEPYQRRRRRGVGRTFVFEIVWFIQRPGRVGRGT